MNDAQPVILQRQRAMGTSAHTAITLQSQQWAGLTWSPWTIFDEAADGHNIPAAAGIYRFRIRGHSGLLYIGEGANLRRRLKVLNKARRMDPAHYLSWPPGTKRPHRGHYCAPYLRQCEDAMSACSEVSWSIETFEDKGQRRAVEARVIAQHIEEVDAAPPCQYGGAGLSGYLSH
jgi:hypothetical protein